MSETVQGMLLGVFAAILVGIVVVIWMVQQLRRTVGSVNWEEEFQRIKTERENKVEAERANTLDVNAPENKVAWYELEVQSLRKTLDDYCTEIIDLRDELAEAKAKIKELEDKQKG